MCAGYHQCKMHPDSKDKTAFIVDSGLYHWNVMPFSLSNSGATLLNIIIENNSKSYQNLHDYVNDLITKLREAYTKLNQHKYEYQMKYKSYYDKKQKDMNFEINDKVMVYFPIPSVGLSYKWVPKYDGPFKVIAKIDQLNYRIQDLKNEKRIFVIQVQRMLKWQDKAQESVNSIGENENIGYK
jgi:hypothetical protein